MVYIMVYTMRYQVADIAKIFMNGRSQAVRLPKAYRFEAKEVYVRRDPKSGDIILSPRPTQKDWEDTLDFLFTNREYAQDFLLDRDRSPPQERDLF
jgi:antitoxin VapB